MEKQNRIIDIQTDCNYDYTLLIEFDELEYTLQKKNFKK